ncbi:MAG: type II toxin-antitoxin system VapC family toxin [Alphaproteobacteria bacterium]
MSLLILDASVAIKWFLADEPGREEALAILDAVRDDPARFAVPELFFNEMLAVLARLVGDEPRSLQGYLDALQDLGFERVGNGRELLAAAVRLACDHGLSGYDAIYAASARLVGGHWLTADAKAHKKIQRLRISKAVCLG